MKATFLILLLSGAVVVGHKVIDKPVIHPTEDKEFQQLMNEFHQTLSKNKEIQVKADKVKEAIVTQTISKVTELKQETIALKTELNEVKIKLDSVSVDTGTNFNILAIPKN
jgi:NifB/MoaA-like Fe-S oxidoreductase